MPQAFNWGILFFVAIFAASFSPPGYRDQKEMALLKNNDVSRVFLLIKNRLLRESLLRLFRKRPDLSIVGLGAPGLTDPAEIENSQCDVLLTDQFSAKTVPECLEQRDQWAAISGEVVLLGMEDDQEQFVAAVRAGATGYLLKDASAGDVVAGIRAVSRGEAVCPPRLCMHLLKSMSETFRETESPRADSKPNLTLRQLQLVTLVAQGMTNKEIASQLNLSEFTVKNHIHRIMKQVDAGSRYEVVETVRAQLDDTPQS